jgi:hypothetical protein
MFTCAKILMNNIRWKEVMNTSNQITSNSQDEKRAFNMVVKAD